MPRWTMTAKSNQLYTVREVANQAYDTMIKRMKAGVEFPQEKVDEIINGMHEAHMAWYTSMPRQDP